MHAFHQRYSDDSPVKVKPSVDVILKSGWRFDSDDRVFVSSDGKRLKPGKLPRQTKIVNKVPSLASAAEALSEDEDLLARSVQVILPEDADIGDAVDAIKNWNAVASVHVPPKLGLPSM